MSTEKERSAVEELRERQITDANSLDISEPELTNFELSDVFEEPEQTKRRSLFGKRTEKESTEIKIKNNLEVKPIKEPVAQVVNKRLEDTSYDASYSEEDKVITADDVAPALLEVQPDILDNFINEEEEVEEEVVESKKKDAYEKDADVFYEKKKFLASQYMKAEEYLEEHSKNGFHFIRKKGNRFYFKKGDPRNFYYSYCYFKYDPEKGDWDQWEKDGWKLVGRASGRNTNEAGWFIFRNELEVGEYKKYIDNDMEKFKLFRRLSNSYRSTVFLFFIIMCVCGVTAYLQLKFHGFIATLIACIAIFVVSLIFFGIYARYLWSAKRAASKLKTALRLREKEAFIRSQNEPNYSQSEDELNAEWESIEEEEKNKDSEEE